MELSPEVEELLTTKVKIFRPPFASKPALRNTKLVLMFIGLPQSKIYSYFSYPELHPACVTVSIGPEGLIPPKANQISASFLGRNNCLILLGPALVYKRIRKRIFKLLPRDATVVGVCHKESPEEWRARFDSLANHYNHADLNRMWGAFVAPTKKEGFDLVVDTPYKALFIPYMLEATS